MTSPAITVLLPVYNGAADVEKAVASVLSQTFTDFELLIINDGSQDNSADLLARIKDPRIRLINQANRGLAATLNMGCSLAKGQFIARQDQDDLSHPCRLQKQLAYMLVNPDCALLGTWADIYVEDTRTGRSHDHASEHGLLCFDLLFNNPFVHSSIMFRRDAVAEIGGYSTDPDRQPPEDYELWSRMARCYRVANLPERLLIYREVSQSMSRAGVNPFLEKLVTICAENLAHASGLAAPDTACVDIAALTHSAYHRLSGQVNLDHMKAILRRAAQRIASQSVSPLVVLEHAKVREDILRHQYIMYVANAGWLRPATRPVRNILRHLRQLFRS